jgi:ubiquitin-activating enzyme E1 C
MKQPALTTHINGKPKTLYMQSIKSLEELTKPNLEKTLAELGLTDGHEILVSDKTRPNTLNFYLKFV